MFFLVSFFAQGKSILMAENVYRHFCSKDNMEKMKMPT